MAGAGCNEAHRRTVSPPAETAMLTHALSYLNGESGRKWGNPGREPNTKREGEAAHAEVAIVVTGLSCFEVRELLD